MTDKQYELRVEDVAEDQRLIVKCRRCGVHFDKRAPFYRVKGRRGNSDRLHVILGGLCLCNVCLTELIDEQEKKLPSPLLQR